MIADSVPPASHQRTPHIAPPRPCPVCDEELPAGYGRHPTCDPRWLLPDNRRNGTNVPASEPKCGGDKNA